MCEARPRTQIGQRGNATEEHLQALGCVMRIPGMRLDVVAEVTASVTSISLSCCMFDNDSRAKPKHLLSREIHNGAEAIVLEQFQRTGCCLWNISVVCSHAMGHQITIIFPVQNRDSILPCCDGPSL